MAGSIPTKFDIMQDLVDIELQDNDLTGNIPELLYNDTKLDRSNLDQNNISGTILTKIGGLYSIIFLFLLVKSKDLMVKSLHILYC